MTLRAFRARPVKRLYPSHTIENHRRLIGLDDAQASVLGSIAVIR